MIGIVVIAHDSLADALLTTAKKIIPDFENVVALGIDSNAPVEKNRQAIAGAIAQVDKGDGVLLLTDLFGGTPTNICLSFLSPNKYEVISGVNLPMLLKLASGMQSKPFDEVIPFIQQYGERNIVIASRVLHGKIER
ncbi:MAG: PTS fructose transporter subunit IIA [Deltaproteobacteria bacterium CG11_big_fil_rev_8_21_14_0_20_47_16]|nr:MAG: PTS fructose transporter subunit IIA [Deltaproteobacteria bacterium CG11_big_fil_rev_8_21_14_0_20_47_16]